MELTYEEIDMARPQHSLIPVFSALPEQTIVGDAEKLRDRLEAERRWDDVAIIETVLATLDILRALVREARSQAVRSAAVESDLWMSPIVMEQTRALLVTHGVPPASFLDDACINAVVQRNRIAMICESLMATVNRAAPAPEILGGADLNTFLVNIRAKLIENGYDYPQRPDQAAQREEDQATV